MTANTHAFVVAANNEVEKLAAAWHAAHAGGRADDATEAEKVAAIASARAGLSRADRPESSEADVAAATDAADAVIAACRPRTLAGSIDMLSLMIEADGGAFISDGLLVGLGNMRQALARLDGQAPAAVSNVLPLRAS